MNKKRINKYYQKLTEKRYDLEMAIFLGKPLWKYKLEKWFWKVVNKFGKR